MDPLDPKMCEYREIFNIYTFCALFSAQICAGQMMSKIVFR